MPRLVFFVSAQVLSFILIGTAPAVETVSFRDGGQDRTAIGEVLVQAQDGGLMLEADDGRIWTLQPEQIIHRSSSDAALEPVDSAEIEKRLLEELNGGFSIYKTNNYVIAYNSTEEHAKRVGALFEQLHRGFFTYWKNQDWDLPDPKYPLVGIVLRDHRSFLEHAGHEIGETAKSVIGYYHLGTNRMTTFNVPNWERNSATIIHEATHQLAYNCGLQRRFADNPMWVSEGMACFFESPDRRNPRKWKRIGQVNPVKLRDWRIYISKRPSDSLATLLADDSRFRSGAAAAYAEAWALTYFLMRTRKNQYLDYLRLLSEGKPLAEQTKRQRIKAFEDAFETTLVDLDKKFVAYMRRVRG